MGEANIAQTNEGFIYKLQFVHTIKTVVIEWDEIKRQSNRRKHGWDFARAIEVFESDVLEYEDDREDYGETRMIAIGTIDNAVVLLVYAIYADDVVRVISLRNALKGEMEVYYAALY